jgi:uncharacterized membrane protein YphA (DoxX/SURF4 family)
MQAVFLIGRVIFSLFWLKSAYGHLVSRRKDMIGYAAYKKVPMPAVAIVGTGILLLIGGLSMLLGVWPWVGLIAIAVFLVGVTPKMHDFWKETDPMMKMNSSINFWKNVTLLGATLMMFAISLPWPLSL